MTKRGAKGSDKIVPLRNDFVRELSGMVEKGFDLTGSDDAITSETWTPELRAFLDGHTLKSLFYSEDWVFIVVDLVASKISAQPLQVRRKDLVEGEMVETVVDEHPLTELLRQPNEWQDYAAWMYLTACETVLGGNAIIWHAPKAGQLITFPFETVTLEFDDRRRVVNYVTNEIGDGVAGRQLIPTQWFKPDSVIHVRRPNPSSLLWGLSPFIPGRKSVLFNRYSADYLNAFYNKQATPGLALSLDRTVNEDVALRQLRSFEVAYQGRKNTRRTLILPKGVEAKPLTHSLSDQNLIEHIRLNRETTLALLKVPPHEVGLQTSGSLGSEEYKTALRNFWEATLLPTMGLIAGALTKYFQSELGEGAYLAFDLSNVEALKDDQKKKAELAASMLQAGLSINEVRQQVWKQKTIDDPKADTPYLMANSAPTVSVASPASSTPSGSSAPVGVDAVTAPTVSLNGAQVASLLEIIARVASGMIPRATGVELVMAAFALDQEKAERIMGAVGDTFFIDSTDNPDDAAALLDAIAPEVKASAPVSKLATSDRVEGFRARVLKGIVDEEARTLEGLTKHTLDMLVGMTEEAIDVILDSEKSLGFFARKELPPKKTLTRRLQEAFAKRFEESWKTEIARTLTQSVDMGYDTQLEFVFNEENRRAIEVLRLRDANKRRAILNARGLNSFAYISEAHTERIMAQVTQGVEAGEAIGKIMKRVAEALGTPDQLIGRAETIARTETLTAVSIGQAAAVENAKEVIPGLKKVWLSAGDDRVRESHVALDGDMIEVDDKFANGLRHPRDVESSDPAEVINCRCTLLIIPPGEEL